jgi:hypothetical protein
MTTGPSYLWKLFIHKWQVSNFTVKQQARSSTCRSRYIPKRVVISTTFYGCLSTFWYYAKRCYNEFTEPRARLSRSEKDLGFQTMQQVSVETVNKSAKQATKCRQAALYWTGRMSVPDRSQGPGHAGKTRTCVLFDSFRKSGISSFSGRKVKMNHGLHVSQAHLAWSTKWLSSDWFSCLHIRVKTDFTYRLGIVKGLGVQVHQLSSLRGSNDVISISILRYSLMPAPRAHLCRSPSPCLPTPSCLT